MHKQLFSILILLECPHYREHLCISTLPDRLVTCTYILAESVADQVGEYFDLEHLDPHEVIGGDQLAKDLQGLKSQGGGL